VNIRNKQSGQILVGTALALFVLLGVAGLAMDMGALRYQRRLQQTAADAAATAAASNLIYSSGVLSGGQNAATQNGFTDNNGGGGCSGGSIGCISVSINNPPVVTNGAHVGDNKYVEAVITVIQPTYFMNIFGVTQKTVLARAVATNISGGSHAQCMITLGPPNASIEGVNVLGSAAINAPHCGIADNGNFDTTGNGYSVTAYTFAVSGTCLGNDCTSPNTTCTAGRACPSYLAPATPDPLANGPTPIQPPAQPAYSASCPTPGTAPCDWASSANQVVTIQPGAYNSIFIAKNSVVTMAPGIYYVNGAIAGDTSNPNAGLNMDGTATLISQGYLGGANPCGSDPNSQIPGVMIFFTNTSTMNKFVGGGGVNVPTLQLCPMNSTQPTNSSGTYTGIQMYQDPNDTVGPYIYGDNKSTFNGVMYFPKVQVILYGNSKFTSNGTFIADSLSINGNPTVTLGNYPGGTPPTANFTVPGLVE
jgi:Flp pilus assembly protein TadG